MTKVIPSDCRQSPHVKVWAFSYFWHFHIEDIEVNVAYRWFLGLDFFDSVPHFSTFGKNYKRRSKAKEKSLG